MITRKQVALLYPLYHQNNARDTSRGFVARTSANFSSTSFCFAPCVNASPFTASSAATGLGIFDLKGKR